MYSYIRGRLVDRVARDGRLAAVQQPMGDSQANVRCVCWEWGAGWLWGGQM